MTTCNAHGRAPYLHPPEVQVRPGRPPVPRVTYVDVYCALPRGHAGPHQSRTKVIWPNERPDDRTLLRAHGQGLHPHGHPDCRACRRFL